MNKNKKIVLIVATAILVVGGFAVTQYWVKKVTRIRGGIVIKQEYTEPTNVEPLEE